MFLKCWMFSWKNGGFPRSWEVRHRVNIFKYLQMHFLGKIFFFQVIETWIFQDKKVIKKSLNSRNKGLN
jgi:hypothetical protein